MSPFTPQFYLEGSAVGCSCIDNFRLIFGRTWMYFAALALLAALYFSLYTHVLLYGNTTTLSVLISVASLVTLCAEVVYYARIMFLVNGRPMKWNIRRCAVLAGVYVLFWLVVALVYAAVSYGVIQSKQTVNLLELRPMFIAFSCVSMLIGVLLIPYVYSGVCVSLKRQRNIRQSLCERFFRRYQLGADRHRDRYLHSHDSFFACRAKTPYDRFRDHSVLEPCAYVLFGCFCFQRSGHLGGNHGFSFHPLSRYALHHRQPKTTLSNQSLCLCSKKSRFVSHFSAFRGQCPYGQFFCPVFSSSFYMEAKKCRKSFSLLF